ncbi:MAG: DUF3857 domain-containing protein [Bacteroidota bacterium]
MTGLFKTIYRYLIYSLCLLPTVSMAQNYPVSDIPDSLVTGSHAVLREYNCSLSIHSERSAHLSFTRVITIFNKEAANYAGFAAYYDKFHAIQTLQAEIYDKNGKRVKHFWDSDFKDIGNFDQTAIYSDVRYKLMLPEYYEYPFTIAYQWEIELHGILSFPDFEPIESPEISLQLAKYTLEYELEDSIRIKELNIKSHPQCKTIKNKKTIEWTISNIPAVPEEDYQPDFSNFMPCIITAPRKFEIDGYPGDMSSWKTFGLWNYNLKKNLDGISEETAQKIKALTANGTRREKIAAVYKFMQSRTRYVNVILGIGGWKPLSPAKVDKLGYGDCKALSEYTHALLEAAGIKSFYTLIYSGAQNHPLFTDFPYNGFNHVIICVPDANDSVWLECTNPYVPAGYLFSTTLSRHALLVNEEGGYLVKMPSMDYEPAGISRNGTVSIDTSGNANVELTNNYRGARFQKRLSYLTGTKEENRTDLLQELSMNTMKLIDFSYANSGESIPVICEKMSLSISSFTNSTPGRYLFNPFLISGNKNTVFSKKKRVTPLEIPLGTYEKDSLKILLPTGSQIEYLPEAKTLDSPIASYKLSVTKVGDALIYIRYLKIKQGLYSPEQYKELWQFFRKVSMGDGENIVLKK